MDEIQQLRLANRQMIAERQALLAEREHDRRVLAQRSVDTFTQAVEGLGKIIEQAAAGDPNSRKLLGMFAERLESARTLQVGIVVPNGPVRPPS